MCGGVGFKIKNIPEEELRKFYPEKVIKKIKSADKAQSFFWYKDAVLPVKGENGVQLKLWGNKDDDIRLPKTGWAKEESLKEGKWDYLQPEMVDLMIEAGYEKKVWFDMPNGAKGIVVTKNGQERVYMITEEADDEYKRETKHNREPIGKKKNFIHT